MGDNGVGQERSDRGGNQFLIACLINQAAFNGKHSLPHQYPRGWRFTGASGPTTRPIRLPHADATRMAQLRIT